MPDVDLVALQRQGEIARDLGIAAGVDGDTLLAIVELIKDLQVTVMDLRLFPEKDPLADPPAPSRVPAEQETRDD